MPRGPRVDAPGLFHHIVVRGVERRAIFVDDDDRRDFLRRLDRILPESGMPCLAWVLIPNHVHLLVRTVSVSISRVMARLGTGYARRFNERHGRVGHLFQNRFGSRPIDDEADLRGVLRYVHLNPLKHGLVGGLEGRAGLEAFPWSGHRALLGVATPRPFHDAAGALAAFDPEPARAREALREEMREGAAALAVSAADPEAPGRHSPPPPPPSSQADALTDLIGSVATALAVGPREIASGGAARAVVRARAIVAYRAHAELGIPIGRLVGVLGVSESSLRRAIEAERRRRRSSLSPSAQNAGPSPDQ